MSHRYLTEADVQRLIDMPTAIDCMQQAFVALAQGRADNVPRTRATAPGFVLHSMSATAEYLNKAGWKQYSTTRQGAQFLVGLYDLPTGRLEALIEANRLGQLRTGAVTGLAVKLLRPAVTEFGLFGTGWQAESQLEAVAAVCPLERVRVYSRDPARRADFVKRMSPRYAFSIEAVDDPRAAVAELPLVVTATTSRTPVFEGEWLADDAVVCAVGSNWLNKAELDVETVRRAAAVVCDSVDCCRREAGDFSDSLAAGVFQWSDAAELQDLAAGTWHPPQSGIIIFKSVGMAIEDLAVAARIIM